jgi:hypothetical protein
MVSWCFFVIWTRTTDLVLMRVGLSKYIKAVSILTLVPYAMEMLMTY